jgi:hypothetical protein
MDFVQFTNVAVKGVPLLFVVLGMVEWFKSFKKKDGSQAISGNGLLLISLAWGLLVGGGYMLTLNPPPLRGYDMFVYYFGVAFYGLAMGLIASGIYDVIKNLAQKILSANDVNSPPATPLQGGPGVG